MSSARPTVNENRSRCQQPTKYKKPKMHLTWLSTLADVRSAPIEVPPMESSNQEGFSDCLMHGGETFEFNAYLPYFRSRNGDVRLTLMRR